MAWHGVALDLSLSTVFPTMAILRPFIFEDWVDAVSLYHRYCRIIMKEFNHDLIKITMLDSWLYREPCQAMGYAMIKQATCLAYAPLISCSSLHLAVVVLYILITLFKYCCVHAASNASEVSRAYA